jgi:hypothetical protein
MKVLFTKYGFEYFIGATIFASIMAIGGYLITSFSLMLIRKERSV